MEREALGHTARFERFIAKMMYVMAQGAHIDPNVVEGFSADIEAVYKNPFIKQKKQPQTAAEIKEYVVCLLEGKEWI